MTHQLKQTECLIQLDTAQWEIKPIGLEQEILGPIDYGWKRYQQDSDSLLLAQGCYTAAQYPVRGA